MTLRRIAGGAYSAPPGPLAGFRGPLRGREEGEREWERGGKGRGEGREGRGGEEEGSYPHQQFLDPPLSAD